MALGFPPSGLLIDVVFPGWHICQNNTFLQSFFFINSPAAKDGDLKFSDIVFFFADYLSLEST